MSCAAGSIVGCWLLAVGYWLLLMLGDFLKR
jgi:hypothetical protein